MTLTEFLLARIAEDEAWAREAAPSPWSAYDSVTEDGWPLFNYGDFGWSVHGPGVETEDSQQGRATAGHIARHDPARVLAECGAKRRMVRLHSPHQLTADDVPCETLRALALPYADYPDFNPDWNV